MNDRRAAAEGRLLIHPAFASRYLPRSRDLIVYLPPGYNERRRYPVLYLHDGQNLFDPATAYGGRDWGVDRIADEAIESGQTAPLIIVGIYHAHENRIAEYTPTRDPSHPAGGLAGRHARLVIREIKPAIDRLYRTLPGARNCGVGGSSLGGLATVEIGLRYPREVGRLAVMSPSVWWGRRAILRLVRAYKGSARPRIWLDSGTEEGAGHVENLRLLRDALGEKGWREGVNLRYSEFQGASHSEAAWGARFGDVLTYLFPARTTPGFGAIAHRLRRFVTQRPAVPGS